MTAAQVADRYEDRMAGLPRWHGCVQCATGSPPAVCHSGMRKPAASWCWAAAVSAGPCAAIRQVWETRSRRPDRVVAPCVHPTRSLRRRVAEELLFEPTYELIIGIKEGSRIDCKNGVVIDAVIDEPALNGDDLINTLRHSDEYW